MAAHKPILLKNLSLSFPHKTCFEGFSAAIPCGSKIAIMGNNGTGKTTLLKFIAGIAVPVDGDIIMPVGAGLSYVPQVIAQYDNLSGGQRFNKALSAAIAANPDILLLDEPTNHLDISNRKSLMGMLARFQGTLIVVSHDPELLRLVDTIWHIENGRINIFSGNYDDYKREISLKRNSLEARLNNLEKEKKAMHDKLMKEQQRAANSRKQGQAAAAKGKWSPIIAGGMKRKAQQTAGRKTSDISDRKEDINSQIKELGLTEQITPSFNLSAAPDNQTILFIMDGKAGYGDKEVLRNIDLSLSGNEKIAIIGDNASGKSTLFKAILDKSHRFAGTWDTPDFDDIGYLDQHYNNIRTTDTALSVIGKLAPSWNHADIRKHLNDFLLRKNEEVNTPAAMLSGGERARLSLAAIACKVPKLLLLDEITNNIDLPTRENVEQILTHYPGAMIVISHDMEFIKTIGIQNIWLAENGLLKKYQPF